MGKRTKTAVHFLIEDGFIVRGTQDPHAALALAVAQERFADRYWVVDYCRPDPDRREDPTPTDLAELADLLHGLLADARPGLYRINPAQPDDMDGAAWWLVPASAPGHGVFQGVQFQ